MQTWSSIWGVRFLIYFVFPLLKMARDDCYIGGFSLAGQCNPTTALLAFVLPPGLKFALVYLVYRYTLCFLNDFDACQCVNMTIARHDSCRTWVSRRALQRDMAYMQEAVMGHDGTMACTGCHLHVDHINMPCLHVFARLQKRCHGSKARMSTCMIPGISVSNPWMLSIV